MSSKKVDGADEDKLEQEGELGGGEIEKEEEASSEQQASVAALDDVSISGNLSFISCTCFRDNTDDEDDRTIESRLTVPERTTASAGTQANEVPDSHMRELLNHAVQQARQSEGQPWVRQASDATLSQIIYRDFLRTKEQVNLPFVQNGSDEDLLRWIVSGRWPPRRGFAAIQPNPATAPVENEHTQRSPIKNRPRLGKYKKKQKPSAEDRAENLVEKEAKRRKRDGGDDGDGGLGGGGGGLLAA